MTAFCCRGKLIKVYGQKNDQKQGKMKGRKKILLLALFAVATLVFSACSKTQTNNDFSVGGIVITDAEFFEISILVNGIKQIIRLIQADASTFLILKAAT